MSSERAWERLPEPLRPLRRMRPGSGRLWLIETTLLVLVGVILATATINDVARQTGVNDRLNADLATWRAYTHHDYRNLELDSLLLGSNSGDEVVCGNVSPGAPRARTQLCLAIEGPVRGGRREIRGGWYIPPGSEDARAGRYGCFGPAAAGICPPVLAKTVR
jgi:hypothetical protein